MKNTLLLAFAALSIMTTGCATRQVIEENGLPKPIMDSRVELNGEYFGKPYEAGSSVSLYLQATAGQFGSGGFGNGGMRFNYQFDPEMRVIVDGKSYVLKSKSERNVNTLKVPEVPVSLVKTIANGSRVDVVASADQGRIEYKSEFSPRNKRKFQEFVQKYMDEKQNVERPNFFMRMILPDDQW